MPHGGAELAGEGRLLGIAAAPGDFGHRGVAAGEQVGGVADAGLADELRGAEAERAAHPAVELRGRQMGDAGELGRVQWLIEMLLDVRDDFGQSGELDVFITRAAQVA